MKTYQLLALWLAIVAPPVAGVADEPLTRRQEPSAPSQSAIPPVDPWQLACAPRLTTTEPGRLHILGTSLDPWRTLLDQHDMVVIDEGSDMGVEVGQQYFVRRRTRLPDSSQIGRVHGLGVDTAGWIAIVQVEPSRAQARVIHACRELRQGDYLERFEVPEVPDIGPEPESYDFEHPGQIIMGPEGRQLGSQGDFMVTDLGVTAGMSPGQRVAIYRDQSQPNAPVSVLGHAVVVSAGVVGSTLWIIECAKPVGTGDLVARPQAR